MADRATRKEDTERHVFDLEKDERWQARLAEARVRREIALREKANSETPPKPRIKPWEADGQGDLPDFEELEALLTPENDDRLDFADRVKTLRKSSDPVPEHKRPRDNGGPALSGQQGRFAPPLAVRDVAADEPDDAVAEDAAPDRSETASIADRYIKALSPDFTPVRPYVPESYEPVGFAPGIVSETLSADDTERVARAYSSTLRHESVEAEAEPVTGPDRQQRRGMPRALLAGICALAILPFTTTVDPLDMGPVSAIRMPGFGLAPALGITRPMNETPRATQSGEWGGATKRAPGGPAALPLDRAADMQRVVTPMAPVDPGDAAFGTLAWAPLSPFEGLRARQRVARPSADVLPGAGLAAPVLASEDSAEVADASGYPAPLSILKVTVLVPETTDPALAEDLVADLELRGHEIGAVKAVNLKITERNIRFFHEEDRGEAARLSEAYGARLRDFTNFRPSPGDGTVEIWLAGESVAPPPRAARPAPQVEVQQVVPVPRVVIVQRQPTLLERLSGGLLGGHEGDGQPTPSSRSRPQDTSTPVTGGTDGTSGSTTDGVTDGTDSTTGTGTQTGGDPSTGGTGTSIGTGATGTDPTGSSTGGTGATTGGTGATGGTGSSGSDTDPTSSSDF